MNSIVLEYTRELDQFIKSQKISRDLFLQRIVVRYHDVMHSHPEKIKKIETLSQTDQWLFELKLPFDRFRTYRIAFTDNGGFIKVVYASNISEKKAFYRELKKIKLI